MPQRPRLQDLSQPALVRSARQTSIPFIAPNSSEAVKGAKGAGLQEGMSSLLRGLTAAANLGLEERQQKIDAQVAVIAESPEFAQGIAQASAEFEKVPDEQKGDFLDTAFAVLERRGIAFTNVKQLSDAYTLLGQDIGDNRGFALLQQGMDESNFDFTEGKDATPEVVNGFHEQGIKELQNDPRLKNNPLALASALQSYNAYESRYKQEVMRSQNRASASYKEFSLGRRLVQGDGTLYLGLNSYGEADEAGKATILSNLNNQVLSTVSKSGGDPYLAMAKAVQSIVSSEVSKGNYSYASDLFNSITEKWALPKKPNLGSIMDGNVGSMMASMRGNLRDADTKQIEEDRENQLVFSTNITQTISDRIYGNVSGILSDAELLSDPEIRAEQAERGLTDAEAVTEIRGIATRIREAKLKGNKINEQVAENNIYRLLSDETLSPEERAELIAKNREQIFSTEVRDRTNARLNSRVPRFVREGSAFGNLNRELDSFNKLASSLEDTDAISEHVDLSRKVEELRQQALDIDSDLSDPEIQDKINTLVAPAMTEIFEAKTKANQMRVERVNLERELGRLRHEGKNGEWVALFNQKGHILSTGSYGAKAREHKTEISNLFNVMERIKQETKSLITSRVARKFNDPLGGGEGDMITASLHEAVDRSIGEHVQIALDNEHDAAWLRTNITPFSRDFFTALVDKEAKGLDLTLDLPSIEALEKVNAEIAKEGLNTGETTLEEYQEKAAAAASVIGGPNIPTDPDILQAREHIGSKSSVGWFKRHFQGTRFHSDLSFDNPPTKEAIHRLSRVKRTPVQRQRVYHLRAEMGELTVRDMLRGEMTSEYRDKSPTFTKSLEKFISNPEQAAAFRGEIESAFSKVTGQKGDWIEFTGELDGEYANKLFVRKSHASIHQWKALEPVYEVRVVEPTLPVDISAAWALHDSDRFFGGVTDAQKEAAKGLGMPADKIGGHLAHLSMVADRGEEENLFAALGVESWAEVHTKWQQAAKLAEKLD